MEIYFYPIPPDTVYSIRQTIIEKAEEYGLDGYFSSCSAFGGVVDAGLPDTPESKALIKWAKTFCEVWRKE